jgi:catalase
MQELKQTRSISVNAFPHHLLARRESHEGQAEQAGKQDDRPILTTRQGHPVSDNQSLRSVGEHGPATLENYQFIEKITHFDRERIPERVVHARGTGAHGWFEAYGKIGNEPAEKYTRAKVLTQTGVRTPVFVRFSTVIGGKDSPETARDPRGFAVKLKTVDGNWDLVGNNLKVFFIRDAIKFPDMIYAFKPDPATNRQEPWRFYDFVSQTPEALHMVTWVKSPWGIPANDREMEGSGVNTYKLVNDQGVAHLVKFHWQPKQGVRNLTAAQAAEIQARDVRHATKDLYDAIERGDFPEWEFCVQLMSDGEHPELDFDPLDDTKRCNAPSRSSCAWSGTCGIAMRTMASGSRKSRVCAWKKHSTCRRCRASPHRMKNAPALPIPASRRKSRHAHSRKARLPSSHHSICFGAAAPWSRRKISQ